MPTESEQNAQEKEASQAQAYLLCSDARVVDVETLFGGDHEVLIRNGEEVYRLRKTRQGKLILNK